MVVLLECGGNPHWIGGGLYPYPVQVARFDGDLTLVAPASEVVVDHSLRIKREPGPESADGGAALQVP